LIKLPPPKSVKCRTTAVCGRVMALYRIYKIDDEGHIVGPPFEFDGVDDDAAVAEARKYVDGHRMEVWESSRHIATIAVPEHGT